MGLRGVEKRPEGLEVVLPNIAAFPLSQLLGEVRKEYEHGKVGRGVEE